MVAQTQTMSKNNQTQTQTQTLEPITPQTAVELYLEDKRSELAAASVRSHKSRLGHFITWCEQQEITNMNELTGRDMHRYKLWRREYNGGIKPVTLKTQMDTVRVFIRFVESIEGVPQGTAQAVQSPQLSDKANVRSVMLETEKAERILDYLEKYRYASREHIVMLLAWRTMMRRGAIRAICLQDYSSEKRCIAIKHRPEADCPLKNQTDGERIASLSKDTCGVIDDWIADRRPRVTDEYGHQPLIPTKSGRIHTSSIGTIVYNWTRPCAVGNGCPLGKEIDECEYTSRNHASKCPETVSPHAIRRGSITHHLRSDVPERIVAGRANVGVDTLERHYDQRSAEEKMEQRREYLNDI